MPNRRLRTRRRKTILGMSDTVFYMIIISLVFLVVTFGIIYKVQKSTSKKEAMQESKQIDEDLEQLYADANSEIANVDTYKSDTIVRISAVGDILYGKNLQSKGEEVNTVFEDIKEHLKDANISVGTYETDNKEFANTIKESGINTLSLVGVSNENIEEMNNYLNELDIETVGINEETSTDRVKIVEKRGVKFAIVSYTTQDKGENINKFDEEKVKEDLMYAKENAKVVICLMHWGNANSNTVTQEQEEQANFLIENGVNIIIGSHPQALQKLEMKENKDGKQCLIAYSLGNYTSDASSENAKLGVILNMQIYITKDDDVDIYKVDYTPIYMNDKILDIKKEIANYEAGEENIDKATYEKLVNALNKLNNIITK